MITKDSILKYFKGNSFFYELEEVNNVNFESEMISTNIDLFEYDNYCSNKLYLEKYKNYLYYDDIFLRETITYLPQKEYLNVVFLGCGNLCEITIFLNLLNTNVYKEINIICIDKILWKLNNLNQCLSTISKSENINLYFYESDFFECLFNQAALFRNFDLLYFSRCLNNLEFRKYNKYVEYPKPSKSILGLLRNYSNCLIAISQVVNPSNHLAIELENSFIKKFSRIFNTTLYPDKHFDSMNIKFLSNNLGFYLYILKGLKNNTNSNLDYSVSTNVNVIGINSYQQLRNFLLNLNDNYIIVTVPEINQFDNYETMLVSKIKTFNLQKRIINNLFILTKSIDVNSKFNLIEQYLDSIRINELYNIENKNIIIISNNDVNKADIIAINEKLKFVKLESVSYIKFKE